MTHTLLAVVFIAFSPTAVASEPGAKEAKIAKAVAKEYTKRWACPDSVTASPIADSVEPWGSTTTWAYDVTGCGQQVFVSAPAKSHFMFVDDTNLRKRVPIEWSCAGDDLTWTFVDRKTRVVKGCEMQATYVWANDAWVANTVKTD